MGSDALQKNSLRSRRRRNVLTVGAVLSTLIIVSIATIRNKQNDSAGAPPLDLTHIPERCHKVARRFHESQRGNYPNQKPKPPSTVVIACHRKWCDSFGHCEFCGGIGDRTRHLLWLAYDVHTRGLRVEIDYPQNLDITPDAIYHDKWGWIAELFHFRSYKVGREHRANVDEWDKKERSFVHIAPEHYIHNKYDRCMFHVLFRTPPSMQQELDSRFAQMGKNVIGIHFRTGDEVSFNVRPGDIRAADPIPMFEKMMQCAESLAERLFPSSSVVDDNDTDEEENGGRGSQYSFYLATDNQSVKDMVSSRQGVAAKYDIHTTDVRPTEYLKINADRNAWMELLLLSMMKGLVVNVTPDNYKGEANRISMFALLAKDIGFMEDNQVMECKLD